MKFRFFERPSLVFSVAALSLLAALEVPIFISCFCLILWSWKWLAEMEIVSPLARRTTSGLSVLVLAVILFQYRTFLSQESSSALLVSLMAIKVMDYENRRDHLLVILLGFLLLTLKPLYGLDLYWLPVQLICMISLWWALSQDPRKIPRPVLGAVMASALPIAILLFLIFPRLVLPWALSRTQPSTSQMGYSNDLNPGRVAELAASNDLVFRVRFLGTNEVRAQELYWKGVRLTISEGLAWKGALQTPKFSPPEIQPAESDLEYELILEPGSGETVFTLDPTYSLKSSESLALPSYPTHWRAPGATSRSRRFVGRSHLRSVDQEIPDDEDLQVPELPPQTSRWVRATKARFANLNDRRAALHDLFSQNDFTYTLQPGVYSKSEMDEFLFVRRRGFCEHFAGAYATLARALGIPARVISGYQGAEYNPLGEFWRVTQRNAHAWVEVWDGAGWVRQDPTLWAPRSEFNRSQHKNFFEWLDNASDLYETMNYRWTTFLIDFDLQTQKMALREWLPHLFLFCLLFLAAFFIIRLLWSWFFTPGNKAKNIRHHQLSLLVQQIRDAEEAYQNRDLSHVPPLQVLQSAQEHLYGSKDFYSRVMALYDRTFYQESVNEVQLRIELLDLHKKWMEIQVLQK